MNDRPAANDRRYIVISSDDHGGADLRAYKPYLELAPARARGHLQRRLRRRQRPVAVTFSAERV